MAHALEGREGARRDGGSVIPESLGPYRLLRLLGAGGMGVVFEGVHVETGGTAALKVLRAANARLAASFRAEILALRRIDHPGVVRLLDDGEEGRRPWYAMERLEGVSLATLVAKIPEEGETRLWEVLGLVRRLCETLAHVHGAGIVHRDLKPENVVVRDGRPILVDFGLATLAWTTWGRDRIEVEADGRGTPAYMAPELVKGEAVDGRADLYAVGCLLFECFTGAPPFAGRGTSLLRDQRAGQLEPPLLEPVVAVPAKLVYLAQRLLSPIPADRIGDALEVARRLASEGAGGEPWVGLPRPPPTLYRPRFAGRAAELERLADVLVVDERARSHVALVVGPPGIGKTRLARELGALAQARAMRVITGRATTPVAGAPPLKLLAELLTTLLDECHERPHWSEMVLGDEALVLAAHDPRFATHLRAPRTLPNLIPEAARYRLLDALVTVVRRYAAKRPLFLALDDVQWADELSLAFLQRLSREDLAASPLRVVLTARTGDLDLLEGLVDGPRGTRIELEPLPPSAIGAVVADMLGLEEPPPALTDDLARRADGIPFVIGEYLRWMVEEELVVRDDEGGWCVPDEGMVVGDVREVARRRYAHLDDDARTVVDAVTVIGQTFRVRLVARVAGLSLERVVAAMAELQRTHWIEPVGRGAYCLAHDLLLESRRETMTEARRRALHGAAAAALEEMPPRDTLGGEHGAMARHLEEAGRHAEAVRYRERAGEEALAVAAFGEAREHFSRALFGGYEGDEEARARRLRRLGEAYYHLGRRHEAAGLLGEALKTVVSFECRARRRGKTLGPVEGSLDRLREAAWAAERLAQVHFFLNQQGAAISAGVAHAILGTMIGPSPELARSLAVLAVAVSLVPAPTVARRVAAAAQRAAHQAEDLPAQAFANYLHGLVDLNAGRLAQTRSLLEWSRRTRTDRGDVHGVQEVHTLLATSVVRLGSLDDAERAYRELLEWAERVDNDQCRVWALSGLGMVELRRGHHESALARYRASEEAQTSIDDRAQAVSDNLQAVALWEVGARDEAMSRCQRTLERVRGTRPAAFHCLDGTAACCHVFLSAWPADRAAARRSVALHARWARPFGLWGASSCLYRGWLAALEGKPWRAARWFRRGLRHAERRGQPLEAAELLLVWGRVTPPGAARETRLRRARSRLRHLGVDLTRGDRR